MTTEQFEEYEFENQLNNCLFEYVMPVVPTLKLPDDAVTQIDDALSELEASDYREWVSLTVCYKKIVLKLLF